MKTFPVFKGAPAALTTAISMMLFTPVMLVTLGCSSSAKDNVTSKPNISTFVVAKTAPVPSTSPEQLTITAGTSAYLAVNFAQTGGTAVLNPGAIPMVSGVPVQLGPLTATTAYTLTVTNGAGDTVTKSTSIKVVPPALSTITTGSLNVVTQAQGLTASVPAVTGSTYVWSIKGGSITSGGTSPTVTFSPGNAGAAGATAPMTLTCVVTNEAKDALTGTLDLTITARPPVGLAYASPSTTYYKNIPAQVNVPSLGLTGDPVQVWTITPALPDGLVFNTADGTIAGTPTTITPSGTYQVSAANTGGSISTTLTIQVKDTPAVTLTANPPTIGIGGTSILSWTSDASVASVKLDQGLAGPFTVPTGSKNVSPAVTTTYTLTGTFVGGGTIDLPAKVTVLTAPVAYTSISATPPLVAFGDSTTLSWVYNNSMPTAQDVNGTAAMGTTFPVSPVKRQTFKVTGSNSAGAGSISITVPARGIDALAGHTGGTGMRDGVGQAASFSQPNGITADAAGNLYVADTFNFTIRKITPAGVVTTLAGSPGVSAFVDGKGSTANFRFPFAIDSDKNGTLVVAEWNATATGAYQATGGKLRIVKPDGTVLTVTGTDANSPATGAGNATSKDWVQEPYGVAIDRNASTASTLVVWYCDYNWRNVGQMKIDTTTGVATLVNASVPTNPNSYWSSTSGLTVGPDGTVYIADTGTHTIKKLVFNGTASTVSILAGVTATTGLPSVTDPTAACLNKPYGITTTANGSGGTYVFIADKFNNAIRRLNLDASGAIIGNKIELMAGSATAAVGAADGPGATATFCNPQGITFANNTLYVLDSGFSIYQNAAINSTKAYNNTVRAMDNNAPANAVTTFAGASYNGTVGNVDGDGAIARFKFPTAVAADSASNVFVADYGNGSIRKVDTLGAVSTVVTGLTNPAYVAVDASDNVYFIEKAATATTSNLKYIKKADGSVQTVALTGGTLANTVTAMSIDAAQTNLYVGDGSSIKQIALATGAVTTLAVTGAVNGICADSNGIYWTDTANHLVRTAPNMTGAVSTLAGTLGVKGFVDGPSGTSILYLPTGLLRGVDPVTGHKVLFIADAGNSAIRVLDLEGTGTPLSTFIGVPSTTNWVTFYGNTPGKLQTGSTAVDGSIWRPAAITATPAGDFVIVSNNGLVQITAPNKH